MATDQIAAAAAAAATVVAIVSIRPATGRTFSFIVRGIITADGPSFRPFLFRLRGVRRLSINVVFVSTHPALGSFIINNHFFTKDARVYHAYGNIHVRSSRYVMTQLLKFLLLYGGRRR